MQDFVIIKYAPTPVFFSHYSEYGREFTPNLDDARIYQGYHRARKNRCQGEECVELRVMLEEAEK